MEENTRRITADIDEDEALDNEDMTIDTDEELGPVDDAVIPSVDSVLVTLPSGELLDVEAVDAFLRRRPAILVTVIGDTESGKTTLICSLYDRFCYGPFAGFLFAGSASLTALERRVHYARAVSGRPMPDTPRTSFSEGLGFFHLALAASVDPCKRHDLLLSDRAGEVYRAARDSSVDVQGLIEIAKADVVVLLIDGNRLTVREERTGVLENGRQLLRVFIDNGSLGTQSRVQVVFTKGDLLQGHADEGAIRERIGSFQERLMRSFAHKLGELSFWEIAALDPTGRLPQGWGVDALLNSWLAPEAHRLQSDPLPSRQLSTEFDRLLIRTKLEAMS